MFRVNDQVLYNLSKDNSMILNGDSFDGVRTNDSFPGCSLPAEINPVGISLDVTISKGVITGKDILTTTSQEELRGGPASFLGGVCLVHELGDF